MTLLVDVTARREALRGERGVRGRGRPDRRAPPGPTAPGSRRWSRRSPACCLRSRARSRSTTRSWTTRADLHVPPERRPIGVVFQDLLLFPHLSATENVAFRCRARGVPKPEARERAAGSSSGSVSQARGCAAARALRWRGAAGRAGSRACRRPGLLLLDEPLSALDVGARMRVRELIRDELASFPGVRMIVTHDPVEASVLAERLVLLEDGTSPRPGRPRRSAPRPDPGTPRTWSASTRSAGSWSRSRWVPGCW